ncbi:hypothetical protein ACS0TY_028309 [Phlomoides rotata]
MACVERAAMVSVIVHWRVWAFLALNLLLLAILLTSKSQISSKQIDREDFGSSKLLIKKKKTRQQLSINGGGETTKLPTSAGFSNNGKDDGKGEDYDHLSEEELNMRVEAFITMFRQHLVSDAKGINVI